MKHFSWELFDHPSYSLDLSPSTYHLFTDLKNWLRSQCFNNNGVMGGGLTSQAVDFLDTGIQKLTPRYDKCLNSSGEYVEK
jgi:hypothetical protein